MPQNNQPNGDAQNADNDDDGTRDTWLFWFVLAGAVLFLALLVVSVYLPNLTERVKFFTANALSLLVLVAIVVQVYINRRQWDSMREQADIMRENIRETRDMFYMANRAYFGILGVGLNDFEAGKLPTVVLKVLNAGNTPAWRIRMHSRIDFTTKQLTYLTDANRPIAEMSPILPAKTDREFTIEAPAGTPALNQAQVLGVALGAVKLFVRGELIYEDISGDDQVFPFCLEYRKGIFGDCKRPHEQPDQTNPNQTA